MSETSYNHGYRDGHQLFPVCDEERYNEDMYYRQGFEEGRTDFMIDSKEEAVS